MTDYSERREPLQTLHLTGFKSFREITNLRLKKGVNVLIGANGSGKTNLVSFFEMLAVMMDPNLGLQNYVASKPGRAEAFLFRGSSVTPLITANLGFANNIYHFHLKASDDGSLFFSEESIYFDGMYGQVTYNQGTGHLESRVMTLKRDAANANAAEQFTKDTIGNWQVYHFHNTSSKAAVMLPTNAVGANSLNRDAGNISDILHTMRNQNRSYYDRIVMHIRQVAPFFGDFVLKPDQNEQLRLLWQEKGNETVYFPSQFSDGTIRFICLATLLLQPSPPSTIVIDEPELGLHPHAIMVLAGMMRLAEEKCQLIVSTQSSALIDYLEIEELIIVDRKDGASIITQPTENKFRGWLEEYSLSEIWNKNLMGGRPE